MFLLCPLRTFALPTLGTFVGNTSVPNGEHYFRDSHHAFVVSEVCERDEEILSEDEDDFGNGGRAPVSDNDNDKEQEVDVETACGLPRLISIGLAKLQLMPWCADACPFFLSPNFQFPPLL